VNYRTNRVNKTPDSPANGWELSVVISPPGHKHAQHETSLIYKGPSVSLPKLFVICFLGQKQGERCRDSQKRSPTTTTPEQTSHLIPSLYAFLCNKTFKYPSWPINLSPPGESPAAECHFSCGAAKTLEIRPGHTCARLPVLVLRFLEPPEGP